MRNIFLVLLFAVCTLPIAAPAQFMPNLTPDQQAQVMQVRADAKTASFNALSADHRTKVQAVITQFDSGSVSIADAITQIDAVLTPDESKAVLDQGQKMRDAMRKVFEGQNGGSPPPGGMQGRPGGGGQGQGRRPPDAGRILLQLAASPDALRAAMQP
jgi:hypothetical protein